jgi:hypothetical protein
MVMQETDDFLWRIMLQQIAVHLGLNTLQNDLFVGLGHKLGY